MAHASLTQIAHVLNVEPRWINRLVKEKGFPQIARGQYDIVACVHWYIADLKRQIEEARKGSESLIQAQTRLTKSNADLKEIELAQQRGEVMAIPDVTRSLVDIFKAVRERLLAIPKKAAPQIASRSTIPEIEEVLQTFIFESLNELANLPNNLGSLSSIQDGSTPGGDVRTKTAAKTHRRRMGRRKKAIESGK